MVCLLTTGAMAQPIPRFEIGTGVTTLNHGNQANVGVSFLEVFNITRYLSVEGTFSHFSSESGFTFFDFATFKDGNTAAVEGLFGAKAGYRTNRFGTFVKLRPGFISASKTQRTAGFVTNPVGGTVPFQRLGRLTEKALDYGSVFEYYPSKHWVVRADFGDTLIFENTTTFLVVDNINHTTTTTTFGGGTSSHFQFTIGGQFRF